MARIFISHSSDEAAERGEARYERELRDAIANALAEAGHEVLLDKSELRAGDNWREIINGWIGSCHAAVVVLSSKAAQSAWCGYEVSVLAYRGQVDASFLLVPLLLVPPADLDEWKAKDPTQLFEKQGLPHFFGPELDDHDRRAAAIEAAVDKTVQAFEGWGPGDTTPTARQIERVAELLDGVPERTLKKQAKLLGKPLTDWRLEGDDPALHLATCLVTLGLSASAAALQAMKTKLGDNLADLIDALASTWVDHEAVAMLEGILAPGQGQVLGSSAQNDLTPSFYVWARPNTPPSAGWKIVPVAWIPDLSDPDPAAQAQQIIDSAWTALMDATNRPTRQEALQRIQDAVENNVIRYIVALPRVGLTPEILGHLRAGLELIGFFLLGCDERDRFLKKANVHFLRPPLPADQEERYVECHRKNRNVLLE
ncbi:MAG: toll/interleukin-1 receptor domain-containing protein [Planctomycetota bacterium]